MKNMVTLTDIDYHIYVWSLLLCSNNTDTLKKHLMLNEVKVKLLLLISISSFFVTMGLLINDIYMASVNSLVTCFAPYFVIATIIIIRKYYYLGILMIIFGNFMLCIVEPWMNIYVFRLSATPASAIYRDFIYIFFTLCPSVFFVSWKFASSVLFAYVCSCITLVANNANDLSQGDLILAIIRVFFAQVPMGCFLITFIELIRQDVDVVRDKELFTSKITHELRTPLHAICGVIEMLEATNPSLEQKELIGMAFSSADGMIQLVNDLLDQSQLQAAKLKINLELCPIREYVAIAKNQLTSLILSKKLTLNCDIDKKIPLYIMTDHRRFGQVLLNLFSNAIKYTPMGQNITCTLSMAPIEFDPMYEPAKEFTLDWNFFNPFHVSVVKSFEDSFIQNYDDPSFEKFMLVVHVKDSGCGILPEKQAELFLQYSQLDSTKPGTGLGLSICKQLVELLHGSIGFNNNDACSGTTFWFKIPVLGNNDSTCLKARAVIDIPSIDQYNHDTSITATIATKSDAIAENQMAAMAILDKVAIENDETHLGRVLIAEDNKVSQQLLVKMLERLRWSYVLTSNGEECFDVYSNQHSSFNAVILDGMMPKLNGLELFHKIRKFETENKLNCSNIALFTTDADADAHQHYRSGGIQLILVKPFTIQQLKKCLSDLYRVSTSEIKNEHISKLSYQSHHPTLIHVVDKIHSEGSFSPFNHDTTLATTLTPKTIGLESLNLITTSEIDNIRSKVLNTKRGKIPDLPTVGGLRASNDINKSPSRSNQNNPLPAPMTIPEFTNISPIDPFTKSTSSSLISDSAHTVLCADDNLMNQKLVSKFLNLLGYKYIFANDGEECYKLYSASPSKFCLILMDCSMPIKDGFESTVDIRNYEVEKNLPKIRICALTADNSRTNQDKCYKSGMDFFLAKPASSRQLAVILNAKFSSNSNNSPSLVETQDRSHLQTMLSCEIKQSSSNASSLSGN